MLSPPEPKKARTGSNDGIDEKSDTNNDHCFNVVSLDEWIGGGGVALQSENGFVPLPLVDLRPSKEFEKCHISFQRVRDRCRNNILAGKDEPADRRLPAIPIVNLPFELLQNGQRSCELPPRHIPFAILIPNKFVSSTNKNVVDPLILDFFFASISKATQQSRVKWKVEQVLLEGECSCAVKTLPCEQTCTCLWKQASTLGMLSEPNEALPCPLPRLWQPDPVVENELLPLLLETLAALPTSTQTTKEAFIWDLGCGSGRDICYLAEEYKRARSRSNVNPKISSRSDSDAATTPGEQVQDVTLGKARFIGFDNHKGSAARCLPFWKNRMVDDCTETRLVDLNKVAQFDAMLEEEQQIVNNNYNINGSTATATSQVVLCYCIRFLNRKLLVHIATSKACTTCSLQKGAIFAISHFCKEEDGGPWPFAHPKEKHVLDRSELSKLFGDTNDGDWIILKDSLVTDSDHGRTMIHFIARKDR
jgi:hypothetical protein